MSTTHHQPATMSVEQAGTLLGISRRSAYRAAANGHLPTIRLGRRLLVPTHKLYDLLGIPATDLTGNGDNPDGTDAAATTAAPARSRSTAPATKPGAGHDDEHRRLPDRPTRSITRGPWAVTGCLYRAIYAGVRPLS